MSTFIQFYFVAVKMFMTNFLNYNNDIWSSVIWISDTILLYTICLQGVTDHVSLQAIPCIT